MIYKLIETVICWFYDKYVSLDNLCLYQDKLSKLSKTAMKKIYANISEIGIPYVFMNLVSCHGF